MFRSLSRGSNSSSSSALDELQMFNVSLDDDSSSLCVYVRGDISSDEVNTCCGAKEVSNVEF